MTSGCHQKGPGGHFVQTVLFTTSGAAAVGALLLRFRPKLGLVRSKDLPAGLHTAEASYVSGCALTAFLGDFCEGGMVT